MIRTKATARNCRIGRRFAPIHAAVPRDPYHYTGNIFFGQVSGGSERGGFLRILDSLRKAAPEFYALKLRGVSGSAEVAGQTGNEAGAVDRAAVHLGDDYQSLLQTTQADSR